MENENDQQPRKLKIRLNLGGLSGATASASAPKTASLTSISDSTESLVDQPKSIKLSLKRPSTASASTREVPVEEPQVEEPQDGSPNGSGYGEYYGYEDYEDDYGEEYDYGDGYDYDEQTSSSPQTVSPVPSQSSMQSSMQAIKPIKSITLKFKAPSIPTSSSAATTIPASTFYPATTKGVNNRPANAKPRPRPRPKPANVNQIQKTVAYEPPKRIGGGRGFGGFLVGINYSLGDALKRLSKMILKRDTYGFFLEPVSVESAPDYHFLIKQPMDLGTMKKKVDNNLYPDIDSFHNDFTLVINNAKIYNAESSRVHKEAIKLAEYGFAAIQREREKLELARKRRLEQGKTEPEPEVSPTETSTVTQEPPTSTLIQNTEETQSSAGDTSMQVFKRKTNPKAWKTRTFADVLAEEFDPDASRAPPDVGQLWDYAPLPSCLERFIYLTTGHDLTLGSNSLASEDLLRIAHRFPYSTFKADDSDKAYENVNDNIYGNMVGKAYIESLQEFTNDMDEEVKKYIQQKSDMLTQGAVTFSNQIQEHKSNPQKTIHSTFGMINLVKEVKKMKEEQARQPIRDFVKEITNRPLETSAIFTPLVPGSQEPMAPVVFFAPTDTLLNEVTKELKEIMNAPTHSRDAKRLEDLRIKLSILAGRGQPENMVPGVVTLPPVNPANALNVSRPMSPTKSTVAGPVVSTSR